MQAEHQADGGLKMKVGQLEEGTAMFDFNHFVVHDLTATGIYQQYEQACPLSQCEKLIKKSHDSVLKREKDVALSQLTSDRDRRKCREDHSIQKNPFSMPIVASKASVEELLDAMKSVTNFQYEVESTSLDFEPDGVRPLSDRVRRSTHILTFEAKTPPGVVKATLIAAGKAAGVIKPRASGVHPSGDRMTIDFEPMGLSVHTDQYDRLTSNIGVDPRTFATSTIIADLVRLAGHNADLFEM
jgi:hypothetical protein